MGASFAIPRCGPDPHLAQAPVLGGQSGTEIPPDVTDVLGTKESVGSSWPRQLLFWRLAPFARFVPPFPVIPRGLLQTPQLFLSKEVC